MFLVRSAFWLTIGFMIVAPTVGADLGAVAGQTASQMVSEGQQALTDGVRGIECESVECVIGRAMVVGAIETNAVQSSLSLSPMQDKPSAGPVPVPPRRPDWAS